MNTSFVILCIAICILHNSGAAPASTNSREYKKIDSILEQIPKEDRVNFLKFHLDLGYELQQRKEIWPNSLPAEFASELFSYAKKNYEIKDPELLKKLLAIVCFEDGSCIDTGDIGVHP